MNLKDVKLFVATPMYNGMCLGSYTASSLDLYQLSSHYLKDCKFSYLSNESLITRARNTLVRTFLNTDFTHMIFIDADIMFNPMDIIKMIEVNKDIICGLYPLKAINWDSVRIGVERGIPNKELKHYTGKFVVDLKEGDHNRPIKDDEPFEIKHGGTGFMLIKREVFNKLYPICPKYNNDDINMHYVKDAPKYNEQMTEYFATSIDTKTNRYLSEDYHFCKIARENGMQVWAAPWAQLGHVGTYQFEGRAIPSVQEKQ